ncbi:hypothetical protein COO60DRAFT_1482842 [Scenedesmus sp. NREL 46B-D3]|nr:hypothetical protein COO60DRAFT_1482842 [Scenedesmus sp. NREL 46B-D3]
MSMHKCVTPKVESTGSFGCFMVKDFRGRRGCWLVSALVAHLQLSGMMIVTSALACKLLPPVMHGVLHMILLLNGVCFYTCIRCLCSRANGA